MRIFILTKTLQISMYPTENLLHFLKPFQSWSAFLKACGIVPYIGSRSNSKKTLGQTSRQQSLYFAWNLKSNQDGMYFEMFSVSFRLSKLPKYNRSYFWIVVRNRQKRLLVWIWQRKAWILFKSSWHPVVYQRPHIESHYLSWHSSLADQKHTNQKEYGAQ